MMRPPPLPRHTGILTVRLARWQAQTFRSRYYSQVPQNEVAKNVGQKTPFVKEEPVDPRPKWMFSTASLLRVVLIPGKPSLHILKGIDLKLPQLAWSMRYFTMTLVRKNMFSCRYVLLSFPVLSLHSYHLSLGDGYRGKRRRSLP